MTYYLLKVYAEDESLKTMYSNIFEEKQKDIQKYVNGDNICIDAGIDIFCPNDILLQSDNQLVKMNSGIKCSMYFIQSGHEPIICSYYMYPRSSISKTKLRLANNVGIIDPGYRGFLIGVFDVLFMEYEGSCDDKLSKCISKGQRLLQICSPNITFPICPVLVNSLDDLDTPGLENNRGDGGFGSTGV